MNFRRKTESDEEYVEKVRKHDRTFRRMRWIWALMFLGWVAILFFLLELTGQFVSEATVMKRSLEAGLLLGSLFGVMFVFLAAQTGVCLKEWIAARHGFRTERLMLKYHDALKEKEAVTKVAPAVGASPPLTGMPNPLRYTVRQVGRVVVVTVLLLLIAFTFALPVLPIERFPPWLQVVSAVLVVLYVLAEFGAWVRR